MRRRNQAHSRINSCPYQEADCVSLDRRSKYLHFCLFTFSFYLVSWHLDRSSQLAARAFFRALIPEFICARKPGRNDGARFCANRRAGRESGNDSACHRGHGGGSSRKAATGRTGRSVCASGRDRGFDSRQSHSYAQIAARRRWNQDRTADDYEHTGKPSRVSAGVA